MKVDEEARYKIALAEAYDVLKFTDITLLSKIPKTFIEFIENNKDKNYISNINPYIPLTKQNLLEETKELLALIYRDYIAKQEEKEKMIKKQEELIEIKEEKNQKYSYENLFKTKNEKLDNTEETKDIALIKSEIGIQKIIMKIKNAISKFLKR